MGKALVTEGQARTLAAAFLIDTPWSEVEADLQPFIQLPPTERGERFAEFLRNGCRVGVTPAIVEAIVSGKTKLWLHPDQVGGVVKGQVIYDHLKTSGLLADCADLAELEAIQAKGLDFFRKHFRGKVVFGWHGVRDGSVPCLYEYGGEVFLHWHWLDSFWGAYYPALRRKN